MHGFIIFPEGPVTELIEKKHKTAQRDNQYRGAIAA
jgi:hypothetical protein